MKNTLLVASLITASVFASHVRAAELQVVSITGDPVIGTPNGKPATVHQGQTLPVGSMITTDGASNILLSPFPISTFLVKSNSTVVANRAVYQASGSTVTKQASDLKLTKGAVFFHVDPGHESVTDFKVHAGQAVAAARGCDILVTLDDGGKMTVTAVTGEVSFSIGGGAPVTITEGHQSSGSTKGGKPTPPAPIPPAQAKAIGDAVLAMAKGGGITHDDVGTIIKAFNANGIPVPPELTNFFNNNHFNDAPHGPQSSAPAETPQTVGGTQQQPTTEPPVPPQSH